MSDSNGNGNPLDHWVNILARFGVPTVLTFLLLYILIVLVVQPIIPAIKGLTESMQAVSVALASMERTLETNTTQAIALHTEREREHKMMINMLTSESQHRDESSVRIEQRRDDGVARESQHRDRTP